MLKTSPVPRAVQNKKPPRFRTRGHSVVHRVHLARCKGLEPLTYWFVASHSIQLS